MILSSCPYTIIDDFKAQIDELGDERVSKSLAASELRSVILAMQKDVGSGVGSFGGHWYTCPNGPYIRHWRMWWCY